MFEKVGNYAQRMLAHGSRGSYELINRTTDLLVEKIRKIMHGGYRNLCIYMRTSCMIVDCMGRMYTGLRKRKKKEFKEVNIRTTPCPTMVQYPRSTTPET